MGRAASVLPAHFDRRRRSRFVDGQPAALPCLDSTLNGVKVDFVLIIKDLIQSNLKVLMLLVAALIL